MKRKAPDKQRSGKRANAATRGGSATRRPTQPSKRSETRPAAKPKHGERASQARAARPRAKIARNTGSEPSAAQLDPRIAAVIALALHDEALAAARAEELARPVSGWTALARARGVQRR